MESAQIISHPAHWQTIHADHGNIEPSPLGILEIPEGENRRIATCKDYHDGGARYDTSYSQGVGLGTITDAMTALKYHVFDQETMTMRELLEVLHDNFEGNERVRQMLLNRTPKYGNDDDYADGVMVALFNAYFDAVDGRPNTKGGTYHVDMLPTTCHIYFGSVVLMLVMILKHGRLCWHNQTVQSQVKLNLTSRE